MMSFFGNYLLALTYLIGGPSCSLSHLVLFLFALVSFFVNEKRKRSPQCFLVG